MRGGKLACALAAASAVLAVAPGALAAPGDLKAEIKTDSALGVSVAFDGTFLYYTDLDGMELSRISPSAPTVITKIPIVGAPSGINAFTYDATRGVFWGAGGSFEEPTTIYLISLTAQPGVAVATPEMIIGQ